MQETFLRAWRSFDQFQTGTNIRAWLFRILFNAFYAQGRQISAGPIVVSLDAPGVEPEPRRAAGLSFADAAEVGAALDSFHPSTARRFCWPSSRGLRAAR